MRSILSAILLVFAWLTIKGQFPDAEPDTTITEVPALPKVEYPKHAGLLRYTTVANPWDTLGIDTTLPFFHRYDPLLERSLFIRTLGNPSSAAFHMELMAPELRGYASGWTAYNGYIRPLDSIRFFHQPYPFTDLHYVQGAGNEQLFCAAHYRPIGLHVRFGVDYRIYNSTGLYRNQRANGESLQSHLRYVSPNQRYAITALYTAHDFEQRTHGGIDTSAIAPDEVFVQLRKDFVPMNLLGAHARYNLKQGGIVQEYHIGEKEPRMQGDSLVGHTVTPRLSLVHRSTLEAEQYRYTDPNPDAPFYPAILLRPDSTLDHSRLITWSNRFGLRLPTLEDTTGKRFAAEAYVGIERHLWQQQGRRRYDGNLYITGQVLAGLRDVALHGNATFHLAGYNAGDYHVDGSLRTDLAERFRLQASAGFHRNSAPLMMQGYLGNHYFWENDFGATSWQQLEGTITYLPSKSRVQLRTLSVFRMHYWDTEGRPAQDTSVQGGLQLRFDQPLNLGKWHLTNTLVYQQTGSDGLYRVPRWMLLHAFWFEDIWFEEALRIQLGFEVRYNSTYRPYAFNPATHQFYLNDTETLDTYPVVDVFANLQVKRARIFFKMEHLNHGLLVPDGYFAAPWYPMPGRMFKFGVSWRFYD